MTNRSPNPSQPVLDEAARGEEAMAAARLDLSISGLGMYFLESLYSDIESLKLYVGIHRRAYRDFHRMLSKRFPFAIHQGALPA